MAVLLSRDVVAEGTMAFRFEKPSGWGFKAGQSIDVTLINPPETDAEGDTRAFSIASAPDEPTLLVATRMRDTAFKRVLKTMPIGTAVKMDGPFGEMTLPDNVRAGVLLAGGIGITPFRSMLADAAARKLPHRLVLYYSNRRPEDAPFLDELLALPRVNPRCTVVATMTAAAKSQRAWTGETGVIDSAMLSRHLAGIESPIYYMAGPPGMIKAMRDLLKTRSVADADIRAEEFSGY